ncbi:MAG: hypothetical protein L0170_00290, partial [Acidobacteria bacterium]|nr:hypothetical protein [Acidobacteriota bacterium]
MLDIRDVTNWHVLDEETRGTKDKCWLLEPQKPGTAPARWLFKRRRNPATGDDWSECVAAQIAELLGIRHAEYQLALRGKDRGVISRDFTEMGTEGDFTPGRDLLAEKYPSYPKTERPYRLPEHTVKKVLEVIGSPAIVEPPAVESFIGYLMLDAIIGNTDRHHENWGVLKRPNSGTIL